MPSDWKFNDNLKNGRVECHLAGDLVMGVNRDWARVSGNKAILQKLVLYFAIPKGEVLNDPGIGCCLHNYIFDKITDTTMINIMNEMEYELKTQIPELGVHQVMVSMAGEDAVKLQIIGYSTWPAITLSRSDLLDLNLLNTFGSIAS